MAKTVLKVKVQPCGRKAIDRSGAEKEIDFTFSNKEKMKEGTFEPGSEHKAQLIANGKLEIV